MQNTNGMGFKLSKADKLELIEEVQRLRRELNKAKEIIGWAISNGIFASVHSDELNDARDFRDSL